MLCFLQSARNRKFGKDGFQVTWNFSRSVSTFRLKLGVEWLFKPHLTATCKDYTRTNHWYVTEFLPWVPEGFFFSLGADLSIQGTEFLEI